MADDLRMALLELLRKAEFDHDGEFLRDGVRVLSQALMELTQSQRPFSYLLQRWSEFLVCGMVEQLHTLLFLMETSSKSFRSFRVSHRDQELHEAFFVAENGSG